MRWSETDRDGQTKEWRWAVMEYVLRDGEGNVTMEMQEQRVYTKTVRNPRELPAARKRE